MSKSSLLVAEQRLEVVQHKALEPVANKVSSDFRVKRFYQYGSMKYGEAFWQAEKIKSKMRERWAREDMSKISPDEYRKLAWEFWAEYEEVNRVWLPEDPVYSLTRAGIALSTTTDLWTLTVGTAGQLRILESYIAGEVTASAVARVGLALASSNGATPTAFTPEKFNSRSPAAVATVATAWTTQPTRNSNSKMLHAFNAFGGSDRWVPQPGEEIYAVGTGSSEQYSMRSLSGTSTVSAHCMWEEL